MKMQITTQTDLASAFDVIAQTPAESVWLANYTSQNSRDAATRAVASFLAYSGIQSSDQLYSVTQAHVLSWRDELLEVGHSNATVANRLALLSSLYKTLADKQLVPANPVAGVRRPKTTVNGAGAGKTPRLSRDKVRQLLAAPNLDTLKGMRDYAILATFFYTGCRVTEATTLNVRDFRPSGVFWELVFKVKGGKTNVVPIHTKLMAAIRGYLDMAGHGEDRDAPLFQPVKTGQNFTGRLTRQTFANMFKEYALAVGLPPETSPHNARSTFISDALDNGATLEQVRKTVAHSSSTTTETYNHSNFRPEDSASHAVNY